MEKRHLTGITLTGMKKNPVLFPLFFCVGMGAVGALIFMIRVGAKDSEITWAPGKRYDTWNDYKNKQAKLYTHMKDHEIKSEAPEY